MSDLKNIEVLALGDRFSAAYSSIDDVLHVFSSVTFKSEHSYKNVAEAVDHVRNSSFRAMMMPNPYGNERRLAIYREMKKLGFPVIAFDRGGLPDSWFFDSGFNADSDTYRVWRWDHALDLVQTQSILSYINDLKSSTEALESQGPRLGGDGLRSQLGLQGKKVLLVPFQRPSDTTIKYFSGSVKDFSAFVAAIGEVSRLLTEHYPDWVLVGKRHPLETENPSPQITMVSSNTHIHDLLEMAEAVCLVNSGVGLLAAAFDKPVYHFGDVYYSHPKLNRRVHSADDAVLNITGSPIKVDPDTRNRLYHYLKNVVYSFGPSTMEVVPQKDGSLRNITRHIDFTDVRLPSIGSSSKKKFSLSLR